MSTTTSQALTPIANKRLLALHGQYERKNGTATGLTTFTIPAECRRCCGQGGCESWKFTGWVCYRCGGAKKDPTDKIIKWNGTPSEGFVEFALAKHEADLQRAAARAEKKRLAEIAAKEAWLASMELLAPEFTATRDLLYGLAQEIAGKLGSQAKLPSEGQLKVIVNGIKWAKEKAVKDAQRAEKAKASEYVGEIGERLKDLVITVEAVISYDSQWGGGHIAALRTAEGHALKWFTSSAAAYDLMDAKEAGAQLLLTGTVKAHETYKEERQTSLTRCKITALPVEGE